MPNPATALLCGAALAVSVGEATDAQSVGQSTAAQLTSAAANPALVEVALAAFVIGSGLLIAALAATWRRRPVAAPGSRLTALGLAGLGAGALWYSFIRAGGDVLALQSVTAPGLTQAQRVDVYDAVPAVMPFIDLPVMLLFFLLPVVLWIGLRRAARIHWLLLVVYLIAVVVEFAFSFQSLPVEAVSAAVGLGCVAFMVRPLRAP